MKKLTEKQELFCQEYIKDLNASGAAERAGYSPKTSGKIGSENLKKPEIQSRIQELKKEREARTRITQNKVVQEMGIIAFSDISEFVKVSETGDISVKSLDSISSEARRAVKKIKQVTRSKDGEVNTTLEYELHDKVRAIDMLGRHTGAYEKQEPDKKGDRVIIIKKHGS